MMTCSRRVSIGISLPAAERAFLRQVEDAKWLRSRAVQAESSRCVLCSFTQ